MVSLTWMRIAGVGIVRMTIVGDLRRVARSIDYYISNSVIQLQFIFKI